MAGVIMDTPPATTAADAKAEKRARKEKKALRKAAEQEQARSEAGPSSTVETNKKESKEERRARKEAKRLAKEAAVAEVQAQLSEPVAGPSSAPAEGSNEETKEERKARRRAEKEAKKAAETPSHEDAKTADVPPSEPEATKGKGKKRKHEPAAEGAVTTVTPLAADVPAVGPVKESKEKKKKKQKITEPTITAEEIFADNALTEQAKKGELYPSLHYVHQHATAHLKSGAVSEGQGWKFNKAKQNWLMRNIWSEEVPDKYVDGVLGYLKTVLGASRKSMLDTAKKYLEAPQEPTATQAAEADADEKDNPKDSAVEGGDPVAAEGDEEQLRQLRRARAEKLLSALNE